MLSAVDGLLGHRRSFFLNLVEDRPSSTLPSGRRLGRSLLATGGSDVCRPPSFTTVVPEDGRVGEEGPDVRSRISPAKDFLPVLKIGVYPRPSLKQYVTWSLSWYALCC